MVCAAPPRLTVQIVEKWEYQKRTVWEKDVATTTRLMTVKPPGASIRRVSEGRERGCQYYVLLSLYYRRAPPSSPYAALLRTANSSLWTVRSIQTVKALPTVGILSSCKVHDQ